MSGNGGAIHLDLAGLALAEGDTKACTSHVKLAEGMAREIGDKLSLCLAAALSGLLTVKTGLSRVGIRAIERQKEVADKIEDIHLIIHIRSMLGEALFTGGDEKDKAKGEQLLTETLTLAREKEFMPKADRIERLLAGDQSA